MARFDLTDVAWDLIRPLLPNTPRGAKRVDDRRLLNGIFWVLRTGSPCRDVPERYGPPTTIYNRWAKTADDLNTGRNTSCCTEKECLAGDQTAIEVSISRGARGFD